MGSRYVPPWIKAAVETLSNYVPSNRRLRVRGNSGAATSSPELSENNATDPPFDPSPSIDEADPAERLETVHYESLQTEPISPTIPDMVSPSNCSIAPIQSIEVPPLPPPERSTDCSLTYIQSVEVQPLPPDQPATTPISVETVIHRPETSGWGLVKVCLQHSDALSQAMERLTSGLQSEFADMTVSMNTEDETIKQAVGTTPRQYDLKKELKRDMGFRHQLRGLVADSLKEQLSSMPDGTDELTKLKDLLHNQQAHIVSRPDGHYAIVGPRSVSETDAGAEALGATSIVSRITAPRLCNPDRQAQFQQAEEATNKTNASLLADKLGSTLRTLGHDPIGVRNPAEIQSLKEISNAYDLEGGYGQFIKPKVKSIMERTLRDQTTQRKADGRSGQGTASGIFFEPRINPEISVDPGSSSTETKSVGPESLVFDLASNGYFDEVPPGQMPPGIDFSTFDGDWKQFRRTRANGATAAEAIVID
ncbi:hypothetical protein IAT40_005011 [Kwoniella sp. CBS 6097]